MPPRPEYTPVPTARPEETRGIETPSVRVGFPDVHITDAVGRALESVGKLGYGTLSQATRHVGDAFDNLGRQIGGVGDELFKRAMGLQELENETQEKKALVEYERYAMDKRLEFNQLAGDAASASTMKAHIDDLEKKRQELRAKLPPITQRSFDGSSIPIMGREGIHAAGHAATETKKAATGASEARMNSAIDAFGKSTSVDEAESKQFYDTIAKEVYGTFGPIHGMRKDEMDVYFRAKTEKGIGAKLLNIGDNDPKTALRMLEESKDWVGAGAYDQLKKTLNNRMEEVEGRNIADRVENEMRDKPLEDKIEKVKERAREINPDNPDLPAKAESRLITMHNIHQKEEKEELQKNLDTALDAAYGYGAPGGVKPRYREELEIDEKAKVAYDNLRPAMRARVDAIMEKNAKEDYPETPVTREVYNKLLGAAKSDNPKDVNDFMQTNLEELKIPARRRDHLYSIQVEMRGKPLAENPQVSHAMKILQPMLPEPIRTGKSPELRKGFMGALYIGLQDAQTRKGKVPLTSDEIKEIGSRLLQTATESEGFRGWGWVPSWFDRPVFEQMRDVPRPFSENLKKLDPNITDPEILDLWSRRRLRSRFEELQNTVSPKAKTESKPSVPTSQ